MTVVPFPGGAADEKADGKRRRKDGRGDFFAVDRRAWARVCGSISSPGLGVNAAVAYLALARGTGASNRDTPWSVNALEKRNLMSRGRAQMAIDALKAAGLVRQTGFGGKATRYELVPAHEVPGTSAYRPALTEVEAFLWGRLIKGGRLQVPYTGTVATWGATRPLELAQQLEAKGYARRISSAGGSFEPIAWDEEEARRPDWVWLPNSLIDGALGDVAPPVEIVRRTQDVLALRLLVDLYHEQDLAEFGGLSWRTIRRSYEREQLAQAGPFIVWAFSPKGLSAWMAAPIAPHFRGADGSPERQAASAAFWARWETLCRLGLVEEIPYLIEADTESAGVIHACALKCGEEVELDIGHAAREAALAMLPSNMAELYRSAREVILAPVPLEYAQVQLVGLCRLRYRSRNARTGAWWARLQGEGAALASVLKERAQQFGALKN
ncbi:hypothetical protein [Azospirillum sp. B2RO_4]|uniref:hypothetical protein n=1 Tax=Azospirillum sp. B2RO_4 TaxID=3027796 RepID=UPI003DA8AEC8